jgi:hypothetical protein
MFTFRKTAAFVVTSLVAASTLLSASAASTDKNLSSNFTLVNLVAGTNNGQIAYVLPNGDEWRSTQVFDLDGVGDQAIYRQYEDGDLDPGSGSVVVSTDGPVGAVVQIQARNQTPTSGAYIGVSEGAASANVPLVSKQGSSLSGQTNSQIIIQNASTQQIDVEVKLINSGTGAVDLTKTFNDLNPNASVEYDLDDEPGITAPWFGSASVTSLTAGGQVAVVSNFFTGDNAMQTFNAFTQTGTKWFAPLFTSRLGNGLSTPIAVQNVSGGVIPPNSINLSCTKDPSSPAAEPTIQRTNAAAVNNTAAVFFNPAPDDSGFPANWYGSCKVDSGAFQTAMFVQMRFVGGDRAGAYEGILGTGTNTTVVIPLYAKRLGNTFASAITIQNLNEAAAATVTLNYRGADGSAASCTQTFSNVSIPAGGSLIQNHRIESGANSVPEIANGCVGTLTVTGNQPIDAFVQLDFTGQSGDAFMAHNAFTVSSAATE